MRVPRFLRASIEYIGGDLIRLFYIVGDLLLIEFFFFVYFSMPSAKYSVMISPEFTQEQVEVIASAIQMWVKDGGPVAITSKVGPCPKVPGVVDACFVPVHNIFQCLKDGHKDSVGCTTSGALYAEVKIDVDFGTNNTLAHLAEHEMGHVMGILDNDQENTVMYRLVDSTKELGGVAPADISAYWSLREGKNCIKL